MGVMETQAPTFLEQSGLDELETRAFHSLIEELIGVPYEFSPESTSRQLLLSLHNRRGGRRLEVAEMPPPALDPGLERDLMWIRPLTAEEQSAPYIVGYDVNAAYLAACSALPLGVGAPIHGGGQIEAGFSGKLIGYFRIGVGPWITTPSMEWDIESHERQIRDVETWTWVETSRPLEPWYKVLRDARETLMIEHAKNNGLNRQPVIETALACVKKMYTGFIGRLCATSWDRTGDVLFRPDWRHMIIATRRTRLQRIMALCDPAPFAAYSDCLYFATERRVTGLKMGTNPGSFKIHGTEPHEGDVREAIAAGNLQQLARLVSRGW